VTFHVSRVQATRWNWVLKMHYVVSDPRTGEKVLKKVLLQTSKTREPLDVLRESLEAQYSVQ